MIKQARTARLHITADEKPGQLVSALQKFNQ